MREVTTKRTQESGQALLEQSLTLLVFALMVLAVIDLGRWVYDQNALTYAVRKGARYALTDPTDTAGIESVVKDHLFGLDVSLASVTVTQDVNDEWVEVEATYPFTAVTPFVGDLIGNNGTATLQGASRMRR